MSLVPLCITIIINVHDPDLILLVYMFQLLAVSNKSQFFMTGTARFKIKKILTVNYSKIFVYHLHVGGFLWLVWSGVSPS